MAETIIFGIDLGTTCSAIGWVKNGVPRLVNIDGDDLLPSVVGFQGKAAPLVGQPALNRLALEPERTVRSSKRHMGSAHQWQIDGRSITPVDVAAHILGRLASAAEVEAGVRPHKVVITVPAWFTQEQRAETRKAGEQAGLDVVRLINEPTAAALAHAHRQDLHRTALVYDLGGGTFDVSLVTQDGPIVEVQASHGDTLLGGDDFDEALLRLVLARLAEDDQALVQAIEGSVVARTRLLQAVEAAKRALSSATTTRLQVPFLLELNGKPHHVDLTLERGEFERAIEPLLLKTLLSVDQVLADGRTRAEDIDDLLLVGGSTHIPAVWNLLRDRYKLEGSAAVPPERAVALGAAIQGAIVAGSRVDGVLVDVAPYSLSIGVMVESVRGPDTFQCKVITPRNTPLPSLHTVRVFTVTPYQPALVLPVFQGSHPNPFANNALGKVGMERLPPAPQGAPGRPIDVEFRHNLDGMVDIRVIDVLTERSVAARVAADADESAEIRAWVRAMCINNDQIPGDGSDPDPFAPVVGPPVLHLMPSGAPTPVADEIEFADHEEANELFRQVLRKKKWFKTKHPEVADEALSFARRGAEALAKGDHPTCIALYENLSDLLFDNQVFI